MPGSVGADGQVSLGVRVQGAAAQLLVEALDAVDHRAQLFDAQVNRGQLALERQVLAAQAPVLGGVAFDGEVVGRHSRGHDRAHQGRGACPKQGPLAQLVALYLGAMIRNEDQREGLTGQKTPLEA